VKTRWQDQPSEDAVRFENEAKYSTEEALVTLLEGITGAVRTRPLTLKQASLSQSNAPFLPLGKARCKFTQSCILSLLETDGELVLFNLSKVARRTQSSAAPKDVSVLTLQNRAGSASPVLQHIRSNSPFFN
jgi:hypothetical protein